MARPRRCVERQGSASSTRNSCEERSSLPVARTHTHSHTHSLSLSRTTQAAASITSSCQSRSTRLDCPWLIRCRRCAILKHVRSSCQAHNSHNSLQQRAPQACPGSISISSARTAGRQRLSPTPDDAAWFLQAPSLPSSLPAGVLPPHAPASSLVRLPSRHGRCGGLSMGLRRTGPQTPSRHAIVASKLCDLAAISTHLLLLLLSPTSLPFSTSPPSRRHPSPPHLPCLRPRQHHAFPQANGA